MRVEGFYQSCGEGRIHYVRWIPDGPVRAVVQIIHGMAEMILRYDDFAEYLCARGYLVTGEDHMGHGQSTCSCQGYFKGGWMSVVNDTMTLFHMTKKEYPDVPYVFLGHSMGSFLLRTILCRYPGEDYQGAIVSGTGWQPRLGLPVMEKLCRAVCRKEGETSQTPFLNRLVFGSYNLKVEHRKTEFDWLTRDRKTVEEYLASPECGFPITAGMFRDLMMGLQIIEDPDQLKNMDMDRPVLFAAGTMDPVGSYGKGVKQAANAFRKAGVKHVSEKYYPLCRHEILNELNREEVYGDFLLWLEDILFRKEII